MSPDVLRRRHTLPCVLGIGLAAALVAVFAAPSAASTVSLGSGSQPGVAVDSAGTAYIAWNGPANTNSLEFCRLPRGAAGCDSRHAIEAPGATIRPPFVVVSQSRVVVVQFRYGSGVTGSARIIAFTSNDRGDHFGAGREIGTVDFAHAVAGPSDTISGITDAASASMGMAFQNVPLDGSGPTVTGYPVMSPDHPYSGNVGFVDATTPLVIFADGSGAAQFRRYTGSGSLNVASNWTPAVDIGTVRYPRLASGPAGLSLLTTTDTNALVARRFNGTNFGIPVTVSEGANAPTMDAFQDAGGRLHVVFQRGGPLGLHLIHAVSDDGATWRSGTVAATSVAVDNFGDTRVATAADHIGVAVWKGMTAIGAGPDIRVAAVGPDAPQHADTVTPPPPPAPPAPPVPLASAAKPKPGITATGKGKRSARKVRVTITAKLGLPAGIAKAAGCTGTIKITIARAKKALARKTVKVRSSCAFGLKLNLPRSKVKNAKTLTVTLSYSGNAVLAPTTKTGSMKVR